jgi:Kef-type K+ transport system membrane component KefB
VSTEDIVLTLAIMLAAGLAAEPIARILRLPVMLVLIGAGSILGPELTGAIDVPLDSTGAQLLLTLGVSVILFNGGLQLSGSAE